MKVQKRTDEQILDIKAKNGIVPQKLLAKEYKVSDITLRYIQSGRIVKNYFAHRLMYAKAHGIDLKDLRKLVCRCCDNPLCINPEHLWEGTHKDNTQDMIRKGRSNLKGVGLPTDVYVGESCVYTKLTYKDVLEIRADKYYSIPYIGGALWN